MTASVNHYAGNSNCLYIWQCCPMILVKLWFCKDGICLWTSVHKVHEVQRNVLQSLQKHVQSIFFSPCFQNNSQNSLSMMVSDKYYEGNCLTALWLSHPCSLSNSMILQYCDLGTLDLLKILWFCEDCTCLWTSWHGVLRNMLQFPIIFFLVFK